MPDDLTRLAIRDRCRTRLLARLTCAQRLARTETPQKAAFERLRRNPEGYRRFLKRNDSKRAARRQP